MVIFVNLEDEDNQPAETDTLHWQGFNQTRLRTGNTGALDNKDKERVNPNKNPTTEALGCYPIIIAIASHIDLNTLDALSLTCRQVRANLLQFRTKLLASTLLCDNEDIELDLEQALRYRARAADWYFVDIGRDASRVGKVGDCARDMVGGCRRCGKVVCRNCTIKPPAQILLPHRHRRICTACQRAPLSCLTNPHPSPSSSPVGIADAGEVLMRAICTCATEGVWLCQPCGRSIRGADLDYESVWKWRARYNCLGVGIGEGNRGVPCGRGAECLASREIEQETDCDAEDARGGMNVTSSIGISPSSSPGSTTGSIRSGHEQMGPGYARHEVEAIGGGLKKLSVKMVKIGACVPEFGDDKGLGREVSRRRHV